MGVGAPSPADMEKGIRAAIDDRLDANGGQVVASKKAGMVRVT